MSIIRENAKFSVPAEDDDARPLWAEIIASLPPAYRRVAIDYMIERDRQAREARAELGRLRPAPGRADRVRERDQAIRDALAICYKVQARSTAAKALARDLARYAAGSWHRDRDAGPPPDASDHRRRLHQILALNEGRPLAWRRVLEIVR